MRSTYIRETELFLLLSQGLDNGRKRSRQKLQESRTVGSVAHLGCSLEVQSAAQVHN